MTRYHENSAILALNAEPTVERRQTRVGPPLYDEAVKAALIVLGAASDRVCGKRLRAILRDALDGAESRLMLRRDEISEALGRVVKPDQPNSPDSAYALLLELFVSEV